MADQTEFKHIRVNAGDEDDVVIYAGAKPAGDASEAASASAESASDASAPAECDDAAPAANGATPSNGAAERPQAESASAPQAGAPGNAAYRGTTLEDLQSTKMSLTQKVVIAVAVAAIAAFVIWYVVANGVIA